jgi:hypothetical protein
MPTDERATKSAERCASHPSRATVGVCDVCGRPLCLECAVPVRGRVLGSECLAEVLGDDIGGSEPPRPWRKKRAVADRAAGVLLAIVTLASLLPWTRFSTGSGFAGAWAIDGRWSMLAAGGAAIGLGVWLASSARSAVARIAAVTGGAVASAGSLLAIVNPPPFTKASVAAWIALAAGLLAVALASICARRGLSTRSAR